MEIDYNELLSFHMIPPFDEQLCPVFMFLVYVSAIFLLRFTVPHPKDANSFVELESKFK